jgi:hypothetical protein
MMLLLIGVLSSNCIPCYAYVNNLKSNPSLGVTPYTQQTKITYKCKDMYFMPNNIEKIIWGIDEDDETDLDKIYIPYKEYNEYILNTMCHYAEQMTNVDTWSPIAFISAYNKVMDNPHNDKYMKLNYPVYIRECGWYNIDPEELDSDLQKRWMICFPDYMEWRGSAPIADSDISSKEARYSSEINRLNQQLATALRNSSSSVKICKIFKNIQDDYQALRLLAVANEDHTSEETEDPRDYNPTPTEKVTMDYILRRCLTDNILLFADHPVPNARMNPISFVEYSKRKDYTYENTPSWDYAGEMDKWVISDHFNCIVGELDINFGSSDRGFVDEHNINNDSNHSLTMLTDDIEIANLTYDYITALGVEDEKPEKAYMELVQKYQDKFMDQLDHNYKNDAKWDEAMLKTLLGWLDVTTEIPKVDRAILQAHPNEIRYMCRVWVDSRNITIGGT